jgi:hypothetical protein
MADTHPHYPEDEISPLGLLQTIADNLRLLFIVPIVACLLCLSGAAFLPKTYASTGILKDKAESSVTSIMLSAAVLDLIVSSMVYSHKMPSDDARKLDTAVGTGTSYVLQGYAQMIEVTKNDYGQFLIFLQKNIALL